MELYFYSSHSVYILLALILGHISTGCTLLSLEDTGRINMFVFMRVYGGAYPWT